jgi:hypothetical protein
VLSDVTRNATKHAVKYIKDFAEQMHRNLGMRVFVLSAFQDTSGNVLVSSYAVAFGPLTSYLYMCQNRHDFNDELGHRSFIKSKPNWQNGSVMTEWESYASEELGEHKSLPTGAI